MTNSLSIARGVQFLLRHQLKDGSWEEVMHTGTGFPRVFYLRYHLYGTYFPLLALATFEQRMRRDDSGWARSP